MQRKILRIEKKKKEIYKIRTLNNALSRTKPQTKDLNHAFQRSFKIFKVNEIACVDAYCLEYVGDCRLVEFLAREKTQLLKNFLRIL